PDRGKVLDAEALERAASFYRYLDVGGDAIPYRTLPGAGAKGAYFTRGSGHDKHGRYTEDAEAYTEVVDRLRRKIDGAAEAVPSPVVVTRPGARYGLVTVGSCDAAVREAFDEFEVEGLLFDYLRVRGFPFSRKVAEFLEAHGLNFVVEQNRDAQLHSMLLLETPSTRERLASVRYYGGLPMSAHHVIEGIRAHLSERAGPVVPEDVGARRLAEGSA
ncbi:MAG: 2-oxoacid:acceptor oxidoreductase subunit alpha, partial [Gemmatimonadota bacterium]